MEEITQGLIGQNCTNKGLSLSALHRNLLQEEEHQTVPTLSLIGMLVKPLQNKQQAHRDCQELSNLQVLQQAELESEPGQLG